MKNATFKTLAAIALCAAAVSCQKDPEGGKDNPGTTGGENIKVSVTLENSITEGKTQWFNSDAVKLFSNEGASTELKAKGNGKTADFTGASIAGDKFYAVYPSSEAAKFADGKITLPLAAEQTAVDGALPAEFPLGGQVRSQEA